VGSPNADVIADTCDANAPPVTLFAAALLRVTRLA
jgi:hypothetical protein